MRFTLEKVEAEKTVQALNRTGEKEIAKKLLEQIAVDETKDKTKKYKSAERAAKKRADDAKEKIVNARNILTLENKKITIYSIAKEADVSYQTAKKYKELFLKK